MEARLIFLLSILFLFLNLLVAQPVQRLSSRTEWTALLELRASLGIKSTDWHRKVNPCSNWTGIVCKNGRVIAINLSGLRRTRLGKQNPKFAVDSLSKFASLSTFNSSGFLLKGAIPEWLGQRLTNLQVLDLRSSSIAGSMPRTLGKLLSLSVLDLSQNLLTGPIPSELSALRNLSTLDLSSNYLSGGITLDFSSLSGLRFLNLSRNSLSNDIPAQLGNLSKLIELDLGYNSLTGSLPEELGGLKSLRKMLVGNNELEGPMLDGLFQKLTRLKYVDVSGNNITSVFPNVTSFNATSLIFNLSGNQFYGNLSSKIGKFHIIDLSNNYFEGSAPNASDGNTIILSNNCFANIRGQRNLEVCRKFYSDRGLSFGNDRGGKALRPPNTESPKRGRRRFLYIMVGVFGGLAFIIVLISGTLLCLRVRNNRRTGNQREDQNVRPVVPGDTEQSPTVFIDLSHLGEAHTYDQMLLATGNFSDENLIKHGHSGDLFRGLLEGRHQVVIKRIDLHTHRNGSFMSELDFFGKVSHPRLVPLLGHCLDHEHVKILVYKYMPNGDLSNALYRLTNPEEDLQSLDWITRLKIATGAAEALTYLHHECTPPVVHRDIQASSILLDDKYEVRLGSFSEVSTPGANNHRNVISRLLHAPRTSGERPSGSSPVTCAYDVYCFGKVLLELVTGKFGISRLDNDQTKQWLDSSLPFINMHEKELVMKIVDQSLIIDEDLLEEVWAVALVAKSCLNPKLSRRPSMRQVLKALENPFKVVREETFSSGALRTSSSRQAWTAAFFGSWHRSSSDSSNRSGQANRAGSRGSGANDHSSSHKRSSSEVFPAPVEGQDIERRDGNS